MKTIEEAAKKYVADLKLNEVVDSALSRGISTKDLLQIYIIMAFESGTDFAQQWINVDDELPEVGTEFIAKSSRNIVTNVMTDHNNDIIEAKHTNHLIFIRLSKDDNDCFKILKKHDVTHWRPIELK